MAAYPTSDFAKPANKLEEVFNKKTRETNVP
jgi:hypothetical protein